MNKLIYLLLISLPVFSFAQADFIASFKTDNPGTSSNTSITIPCISASGYQVDFNNDGDLLDAGESTVHTTTFTHNFGVASTYTIRIVGNLDHINFNNDPEKILSVDQWGAASVWTTMASAFYGCSNLTVPATDAPDLSNCTTMASMFRGATIFNSPINHWDVSNITNMYGVFFDAVNFNQPLNSWDVSNVTLTNTMFRGATSFNQSLNAWNVSSVQDMNNMFHSATAFNQPLDAWNVSNVTNMGVLFRSASNFNQSINSWDVSNVTNMGSMFRDATVFNHPLDAWNVSSAISMNSMFRGATDFDQPINSWNLTNVSDIRSMFQGASSFNQPLSNWNFPNVANFEFMFASALNFNQPLDAWNVSNIWSMRYMFRNASSFNQPLPSWVVSNVTNFINMFADATSFNQALDTWDISSADRMEGMLDNSVLDCVNYDNTLIAWESQGVSGLILGATAMVYDLSQTARNSLINTYGWTINGDTYLNGCNGPLPIELLGFNARLKDNIVYLNWQTASEINNKGFEIEHSTNGNNWQNIGFVNGIDTSFELNNYQFLHQSPTSGINYYRLMQKDFDGAFEYSEVVSVSLALSRKLLVVSPNPVQNGTFNLSFSSDDFESCELEIYDSMGHLVQSQTILNTSTEIQIRNFPKGIYLVSLEMNGQRFLERIIVQ